MMNFHSNSGWPKDDEELCCLTLELQQLEEQRMILPNPDHVRAARIDVGLTQKQAGRIVHATESTWRSWETHESSDSYRQISGAAWELFVIRTDSMRADDSIYRMDRGYPPALF